MYYKIHLLLLIVILSACTTDESYTLSIPKNGFEVVQHVSKNNKDKREKNTLYKTPREIKKEELNTAPLTLFIDSLYAVMQRYEGVGIAANQIGKSLQIFIIEAMSDNPRYKILGAVPKQVFINPIITKVSRKKKNFWHGCLSAQDKPRGNVASFEWIEYECFDQEGVRQKGRLEGFSAVVFQHEYRHLMKGTYIDYANHFLPKHVLDQKIKSGELPFFDDAHDSLPLLIEGYQLNTALTDY
ncbi:peptide deformylase [Brumimicrobium salinarum]|uniref:Peptide deformylase n=1 Tax=Brumimicrobium salinarum TaxID=2058658 RepID=A0A2I0QZM7_9FLAO|nr:peptide deformylase [Brumimicrobium salinarum]PKR79791.1 peptide deformylase [Brumimicrobium salinarum]